jgi:Mg2+-importing ATPase
VAFAMPVSPAAGVLGFVPVPAAYLGFVVAATVVYLMLVELAKERLVRRGAFAVAPWSSSERRVPTERTA